MLIPVLSTWNKMKWYLDSLPSLSCSQKSHLWNEWKPGVKTGLGAEITAIVLGAFKNTDSWAPLHRSLGIGAGGGGGGQRFQTLPRWLWLAVGSWVRRARAPWLSLVSLDSLSQPWHIRVSPGKLWRLPFSPGSTPRGWWIDLWWVPGIGRLNAQVILPCRQYWEPKF